MSTRQIAFVTVAATTGALVLFGRQRRERGEFARATSTAHHLRSGRSDRPRRRRRR